MAIEPTQANADAFQQKVREDENSIVIAIDIDHTAAFGNDTNQILKTVMLLTERMEKDEIYAVAQLLINPKMIKAIEDIRAKGKDPYILFYTQKKSLVRKFHRVQESLYEHGFFSHGQLHTMKFKAGMNSEAWQYLYNQLYAYCEDIREELEEGGYRERLNRLGIVTWVASEMLNLPYSAPVFITSVAKSMRLVAKELGLPEYSKVYLFDDEAELYATHFVGGGMDKEHMIAVERYDLRGMHMSTARVLMEVLNDLFPLTQDFIEEHREFYRSISTLGFGYGDEKTIVNGLRRRWAFNPCMLSRVERPDWDISLIFACQKAC
jgi:hypothetical protein